MKNKNHAAQAFTKIKNSMVPLTPGELAILTRGLSFNERRKAALLNDKKWKEYDKKRNH